jgi:hypothetical protein
MIPLYQYPTTSNGNCTNADFVRIATSSVAKRTIAIVNPNNGPQTTTAADKLNY